MSDLYASGSIRFAHGAEHRSIEWSKQGRKYLFDLSSASRDLREPNFDKEQIENRLFKVYANLMRRQADV